MMGGGGYQDNPPRSRRYGEKHRKSQEWERERQKNQMKTVDVMWVAMALGEAGEKRKQE